MYCFHFVKGVCIHFLLGECKCEDTWSGCIMGDTG